MNDLRFALRQLLKNPGFTAVAVLTLALGIGANTSMFSVLNAILFRALPYPRSEDLVRVYRTSPQSKGWPHSVPNFLDYRENTVFEHLAAFTWLDFDLEEPGQPAERLRGVVATADLFPLLGVQPTLGRVFTAEEDRFQQGNVVVLSHGAWLSRFGGDPSVIGRTLRLNGGSFAVIGVMPAGFDYPLLWGRVDLWQPMGFPPGMRQDGNRGNAFLQVVARLKPGVSLAAAQAQMSSLAARLARDHPQSNAQSGLRLLLLRRATMSETGRGVAWLTMGLALFVLLIVCANLANLQFARTASRAREYAIRSALGAQRRRLMQQLLTESLLLAMIGGVVGLLVTLCCNGALGKRIMVADRAGLAIELDLKVLGFALAASVLTGIVFGTVPAWLASRADVNETLKQGTRGATGGRSQHRLRHALIVAEVALALMLLTGAGFFLRGLHRFANQDPGWRADGLLTGYLTLPNKRYGNDAKRRAFFERLQERLATLPGVEHVAISWSLPIWDFASSRGVVVDGQPDPPVGQAPIAYYQGVSPEFFQTLDIRLVQGRTFASTDATYAPAVAVINETMARRLWPDESPLGKHIGSLHPQMGYQRGVEIVGVVRDVRFAANLAEPDTHLQVYRPLAQEPRGAVAIALRCVGAVENLPEALRGAVAELDSALPVHEVSTARQACERLLANFSLLGSLLAGFALLGLMLAALGIYGVITAFVLQRTNEIGIRFALGAQVRDILGLVLGLGLRLCVAGLLIGLVGAFGIERLLQSVVPELPSRDPVTLAAVGSTLIAIALLACWLPARRAAKVDPMEALRYE